jgi:hypothetical protein
MTVTLVNHLVHNLFAKLSCPEKVRTMGNEGPGNHATGVRGIIVWSGNKAFVLVHLDSGQIRFTLMLNCSRSYKIVQHR